MKFGTLISWNPLGDSRPVTGLLYINNNNNNNNNNKHEIKELQKTVILSTAHILRKVLMYVKYKTYFTGEITLHAAQTVYTEKLQHYVP